MTEYDRKMNGFRDQRLPAFQAEKKRPLLPERASFSATEVARGSSYISSTSL